MEKTVFDNEKYAAEARERWGGTEAYKEYENRKGKADGAGKAAGLMALFAELGKIKDEAPESPAVQAKIGELQSFISENFYTCTDEILKGLGDMYVHDERFRANIDEAGGSGTAEFVRKAIISKTSGR